MEHAGLRQAGQVPRDGAWIAHPAEVEQFVPAQGQGTLLALGGDQQLQPHQLRRHGKTGIGDRLKDGWKVEHVRFSSFF